ncbi:MAG: TonB family protein [Vicinamibacterales bacterium]
MYFEIEDGHPEITPVGSAMSWREGLLLSLVFHVLFFAFIFLTPSLFQVDMDAVRERQAAMEQKQQDEPMRFVFVQPRIDTPAERPPEQAAPSDLDRRAQSPEPRLQSPLPSSRGNTPERVERAQEEVARGRGPTPDPAAGQRAQAEQPPSPPAPENQLRLPDEQSALQIPRPQPQPQAQPGTSGRAPNAGGSLGDALRNLQRYVQRDNFDSDQGGGAFGPAIQFDTKGVEFGPWIRRFIAQVKRNWLIPYAAMSMKGRVVVTFNVHKDGTITDLSVVDASPVSAFNNAAYGALASSNPTTPLPPEYPADRAFFTVTFFYNEEPQ